MKVDIIKIGNSRGIRLPKSVIEQCQFAEQVELEVRAGEVVLRAAKSKPRAGWDEAFASADLAAERDDEAQDFEKITNVFDEADWTWPGSASKPTVRKARKRT